VGNKSKKKAKAKRMNTLWWVGGAAVIAAVVWFSFGMGGDDSASQTAQATTRKPSVETLPPALFSGSTREAYQIAREIPVVLDQLPCFCGCATSFGHRSNLHCFKDDHGAVCDMCRDIALLAGQMTRSGATVPEIREAMRQKYRM
jgi:hypothetical protein